MTTTTLTRLLGKVVWRELMTKDFEGAKKFYGALFGWNWQEMPIGDTGMTYTIILAGETGVGGMMDASKLPNSEQIPSHWLAYVSVADVDAAAKKAQDLGGKLLAGPDDIPNVGRFAVVQDPQGGVIAPFHHIQGDMPDDAMPGIGEFCWEQLNTGDSEAATEFYTAVFGWTTAKMEGAEMTLFERENGDKQVASIFPAPPGVPAHWLTYVVVESLDAANARVKELGGQVHLDKVPVHGIGSFSVCQDPQGAPICLFESERA